MQEHSTKKSFGRHQDKNTIVKHKFDKIIPQDNKKLIVKYESQENIDDEGNEDDLYDLDKMSLDEKERRKRAFEIKLKNMYAIKRSNSFNYIHENKVSKRSECNLIHYIQNTYKMF